MSTTKFTVPGLTKLRHKSPNIHHTALTISQLNSALITAPRWHKTQGTYQTFAAYRSEIYDESRPLATWSGAQNYEHAWKLYLTGWPYGIKLGRELRLKLAPETKKLHGHIASTLVDRPSLVPGRLDLNAAITDCRPEHFVRSSRSNTTSVGQQEFCSVYVNLAYSWCTDIPKMVKFALTIAETITMLESLGLVRFRVIPFYAIRLPDCQQTAITQFTLKEYLQPANHKQLITVLSAPFMLRRLMFALLDGIRDFDSVTCYGMGHYGNCIQNTTLLGQILSEHKTAEANVIWNLEDCGSYQSILELLEPLRKELPELRRILAQARVIKSSQPEASTSSAAN